MEIVNFFKLAIGAAFVVDGEKYIKHSELIFKDYNGLEHYIDPLFDAKLGKELANQAAAAVSEVNTSATIIKDETI